MRKHKPEPIKNYLENKKFNFLIAKSKEISQINQILNKILGEQVASNIRVANFKNGILCLEVSSGAYLHHIKIQRNNIISQLRTSGLSRLSSINTKINPHLYLNSKSINKEKNQKRNQKQKQKSKISDATAKLLKETAASMPANIGEILNNIAKNH